MQKKGKSSIAELRGKHHLISGVEHHKNYLSKAIKLAEKLESCASISVLQFKGSPGSILQETARATCQPQHLLGDRHYD